MSVKEVELVIPGGLNDEPIFYYITKNFKVIPNIREASFSTDMGWAIVRFEGKDKELDKMFKFLEEKGARITPR